jgi:tetratricopeptide (TPR) repeat protein
MFLRLVFITFLLAFVHDDMGVLAETVSKQALSMNEAGVIALKDGLISKAEENFISAIKIDPNYTAAVYNLVGVYIVTKRPQEALDLLIPFVKLDPKNLRLRTRLGDAYLANKQVDQAVQNYEYVFRNDPKFASVPRKLASIYVKQNKANQAEELLIEALKTEPEDPLLLSSLAKIYLNNNKFAEAIDTSKKAIQQSAKAGSYQILAEAYAQIKDYQNALIAYEKALSLTPKNIELQSRLSALKELTQK